MEILSDLVELINDANLTDDRQVRSLLHRNPADFYQAALECAKTVRNTPGYAMLLRVLYEQELLLRILCDPALSDSQAKELAATTFRLEPRVSVLLAKSHLLSAQSTCRLIEILAESTEPARLLPIFASLLNHPDPKVSSKVVLMMGRLNRSVSWGRRRLLEQDARTRANAVEALWGTEGYAIRNLFQTAARDPDNRVAGNALIALYRLGDVAAIPQIALLSRHRAPQFRATAAWLIGETGDPRFMGLLRTLLQDRDGGVRKRAFRSIVRMKAATARMRQPGPLRVSICKVQAAGGRLRQLRVAAVPLPGQLSPPLLPTNFIVTEHDHPVFEYTVTDKRMPAARGTIFILPPRCDSEPEKSCLAVVPDCFALKGPDDLTGLVFYAPSRMLSNSDRNAGERIPLTSDAEAFLAAFKAQEAGSSRPDLWSAIRRGLHAANAGVSGECHLIVVVPSEAIPESDDSEALYRLASGSRAKLHAIGPKRFASLERLCSASSGSFQVASSAEDAVRAVERAYLLPQARYLIEYRPPVESSGCVKVQITSASGSNEDVCPVPVRGETAGEALAS